MVCFFGSDVVSDCILVLLWITMYYYAPPWNTRYFCTTTQYFVVRTVVVVLGSECLIATLDEMGVKKSLVLSYSRSCLL